MKKELRKKILEQRKLIKNHQERDCNIIDNLKTILNNYHKIMIYYPIFDEPNILNLVNDLHKDYYLPYCHNNNIEIRKIIDINDLEKDEENIWSSKYKTDDEVEVIVTPAVAADYNFYRLGYGKGYYDRFFKNSKAIKIVIVYDEFLIDDIYTDEWDISVDYIVTDKKILKKEENNV